MNRRRKRKRHTLRWACLLLFVVAFVAFVVFAVLSERQRVRTLAAIEPPPELRFHHELAEALARPEEASPSPPPPELQPAMDRIAAWKALFQRKREELDGDEWDEIRNRWYDADGWENLTSDDIERIGAFLDTRSDFLAALRETAALGGPMEAVPLPPQEMDMEHLRQARDCARLLAVSAVYRSHTGKRDGAMADLVAGFQFANALAPEPALIPQLTRFGCTMITYHAILESFPPGTLSEPAVTRVISEAQQDPGRGPLVIALEEQRMSGVKALNAMLEKGWGERYTQMERNLFLSRSSVVSRMGKLAYASPLARPWFNRDIGTLSEATSALARIAHLPYYEARQQYVAPEYGFRPYTHQQASSTFRVLESQARHEALLQLLQLGLTLEQHPTPAASLDALAGQIPEEALTDPFTGQRYIYQPNGDTFLLYSVGRNLVDDGGRHGFIDGDIVWRSTW